MGDYSAGSPANRDPQDMNCADYCDALAAERWLRLLDATKRAKRARSLLSWAADQQREPDETAVSDPIRG